MASKNDLRRAPVYFRAGVAKGLEQVLDIQADGGRFGAGFIPGVAVLTRGEALGHGMWVDREFIAQVDAALKADSQGVKSRYTHPDMSGDALAKGLGRVTWAPSGSPDVVRGDLHIWKSARNSPDGDMGAHILERATEDPASFGASISFLHDFEAAEAHFIAHGGKVVDGYWDATNFKSPDPENKQNLPHVRLAKLRAVDVVDDPAANPNGLFHRDETFQEAEALLAYAIGGETRGPKPELVKLGVDPDRASGFLRRFLSTRGLSIVKAKNMGRFAEGDTNAAEGEIAKVETEAPVAVAEAVTDANETETETEVEPEPSANVTTTKVVAELGAGDPRAEVKRYLAAFGAQGGQWYAEGLTFEQCYAKRLEQLSADNAKLRKQLELHQQSEPSALSQGGADKTSKKGKGFSSKLRIQGVEQTPAE